MRAILLHVADVANSHYRCRLQCVGLMLALICAGSARAQTAYPMISHVSPAAVQRGKTSDVVVHGVMNFHGTYQALFEGAGITAEIVPPPVPKKPPATKPVVNEVKLKVTVAADALPGAREFRLASSRGISSIGQIVIVDHPVIVEASVNNTLAQAQGIQLPCVVAGMLEAVEDVDYFKFEAKAGETVTFEVYCARIQDKIHDLQKHAKPMLTLFDGEGRELAANDHFYFADPLLTFTIPRTGPYFIQIRESTYDGDRRWTYALLATNQPHVTHVYPMAGNPGQMLEVEPVGSAKLAQAKMKIEIPKQPGIQRLELNINGQKANPATLIVSPLPQFLEQEPNDEPGQATRVAVPGGINGRIGKARDLDHFIFTAKKGRTIQFELMARRFGTNLNSSLHGVLEVMDGKGKILAANDATHSIKEADLVFTPATDGDIILRVRDLNSKGGDSSVYFIRADFARADFRIKCDPDKAMIGPGSSTAWYVQVERTNGFAGPVNIEIRGLPRDVTASPLTVPPTMTHGVIVLTAAADAKLAAVNVDVVGKATVKLPDGKEEVVEHRATPIQEIYNPGGGRNFFGVNMQTIAVTDPSDILKVQVSKTKISLKPGEAVKIDVTIERRADYNENVSLDVRLQHLGSIFGNPLPPGVTIEEGKSKTLLGKGSTGHIVLKAAATAPPIDNVPICVLAHVSINFVVKVSYSSPPILVSVTKK
ncbi:MAG: pre-peptidase [Planctomycetes bacterium]|nr:pre-peptidase [Planctomycetota bacterium]